MRKILILLAFLFASVLSDSACAQGFDRNGTLAFLKKMKHPAKEVVDLDSIRMSPPDYRRNVVAVGTIKNISTDIPKDIAEEYDNIKYKMLNCNSRISGGTLPIVVSLKSQKNITDILLNLKENDPILLGGKVKALNLKPKKSGGSGKSRKESIRFYVFEVDFLERLPAELVKPEDAPAEESETNPSSESKVESGAEKRESAREQEKEEEENIDFDMDSTSGEKEATPEKIDNSQKQDESTPTSGVEWLD